MREVREKNYWPALTLFIVVIIIAIAYFLIYPQIQDLKNKNIELAAKKEENSQLSQKLDALKSLQTTFSASSSQTAMLNLALPATDSMAEVLESLRGLAKDSVIELVSVKQNLSTEQKETQVDVSFEGSYQSFYTFLTNLENNIRLITPAKINLTQNQNVAGGESYLKGTVNLNFFKVQTKLPEESTASLIEEGGTSP